MIDAGLTAHDDVSQTTAYVILIFSSIALYNVIELTFIIWFTFKRHSGIYFWSFLVATYGIVFHAVGFLLTFITHNVHSNIYITINVVGWVAMVTGQSMVLWSRLRLILHDQFYLRLILGMIITNAIICFPPIIAMKYGANSDNPEPWLRPFTIYEKIQVTIFFLQECVISGFYIVQIVKLLKVSVELHTHESSRRLMKHLILVNLAVIALDIGVLGLEYANRYDLQTSYKSFAYSVKLKLEFTFLNRLVELVNQQPERSSSSSGSNIPSGLIAVSRNAPTRCVADGS